MRRNAMFSQLPPHVRKHIIVLLNNRQFNLAKTCYDVWVKPMNTLSTITTRQ